MLIATIPKNTLDEVRVSLSEYKGHHYLDIRVFTELDGKPEKGPTKKGITLRPELLGELREALAKAETAAREMRLI